VLIEVQSEAEEMQTLIRTGHQQHQELLDDALEEEERQVCEKEKQPTGSKMHSCSWRRLRLVPGRSG